MAAAAAAVAACRAAPAPAGILTPIRVHLNASVVGGTTCFCLVVCPYFIIKVEQMVNYSAPYSGRAPGVIDSPP